MTRAERASQIWALLAWAARNRQTLTYGQVAAMIGTPQVAVGGFLEPIQSYCLLNGLRPLTVLVVSKETGEPGPGFIGETLERIPAAREAVYAFDWLRRGNPGADELEAAVVKLPSR